jgi:small-conductance mechanosensitive channel
MIDFASITEAARDPLVIFLGLFVLGGLAEYFLFKGHPVRRAILRVIFLIVLTIALVHADIVPYQPMALTGSRFRDAVHAILKIAWWVWAAWFLVGLVRAVIVFQRSPREAKLVQDLLAGVIYLAALFAIVAYVFDLPIQGLLATSGVAAIILGLALQSTLGDVFSGIVLSFSRPYRPGDWISVEGGTDGRVIEMNWRATYILTARRDLAILPNSTIAKSKIVNVSSPSGLHGTTVTVQVDARTSPSSCSEILEHAIRNSRLIVATPAPTITIKTINANYAEFEIAFFVEELASTIKAQNELFDFIYRHLAAAGIDLASPQNGSVADGELRKSRTGAERLLELVDIFGTFAPRNARPSRQSSSHGHTRRAKSWSSPAPFCNHCSSSAVVSSP